MITVDDFQKINNDSFGNPRYVIHYLSLLTEQEKQYSNFCNNYKIAITKAKKFFGRKFDNKQYGGGIAFTTYDIVGLTERINKELL